MLNGLFNLDPATHELNQIRTRSTRGPKHYYLKKHSKRLKNPGLIEWFASITWDLEHLELGGALSNSTGIETTPMVIKEQAHECTACNEPWELVNPRLLNPFFYYFSQRRHGLKGGKQARSSFSSTAVSEILISSVILNTKSPALLHEATNAIKALSSSCQF